jgi:hypothetical protein
MRGHLDVQSGAFVSLSPQAWLSADHPLRAMTLDAVAVQHLANADFERLRKGGLRGIAFLPGASAPPP